MFVALLPVLCLVFAPVAVSSVRAAAQSRDSGLLDRVREYVEHYFARAQTIVATETVVIQPLEREMRDAAYTWQMVNEVRFEWDPAEPGRPRVTRQLISAARPKLGPAFQSDCVEDDSFASDALTILLPTQRPKFRFVAGRMETVAGVRAQRVEFTPLTREPPIVEWLGKCGLVRSLGSTRGSFWADPASGEVLRFEEHLVDAIKLPGPPGEDPSAPRSFTMQRADTTIDYKRFAFTDPDETLLLPARIEFEQQVRNSGLPRIRIIRTFTNYRRFLTGGRVLP